MKLVIVESPAKIKTISKYLGKDYTLKASIGHIRDLPKSNKDAINIEKGFIPRYEVNPDKKKVVMEIKKLANKASEVILATDPDREGEAIAWHVAETVKLKNPKRVTFNEITEDAILEAMRNPRYIDQDLRKAQEARRVLDRLFGYDLSGLIWKKVRYGLSAGRVQSPAMRIIMERERLISAFKSEKYWTITAKTENSQGNKLFLVCTQEPRDKKLVDKILATGKKEKWTITEIKETQVKRHPYPPFITSTLQQSASNRFGFTPARTMTLAQRLYEAGLITYMRTDSTNLSAQAQQQIKKTVLSNFGEKYYQSRVFNRKSKNAQEAHEAIRPTNFQLQSAGFDSSQKKLYELIWSRAMASQMADAQTLRTKISVSLEDKKLPEFIAKGSRIIFKGWLKADPASLSTDVEVPKLSQGETLSLKEIKSLEKETQPPARYTEAGLIKELEKRGIGRPSTYAPIIKTIQDRGYVEKINSTLRPTDTGGVVNDFVEKHFPSYINDTFTAKMETDLDKIAEGKEKYEKVLENFYTPFSKDIKTKEKLAKVTNLGKADAKFKCPECKGAMIVKLGKSGRFLSCAKFPKCAGALTLEGKKIEGPKKIKENCPKCGKQLVQREGRFGKFISCEGYPKCKFIKTDPKEEAKKKTGVTCPICKKGEIVERRGRFGIFYSCNNYPKCKYAIKAKPTGKICHYKRLDKDNQECGALMMQGTKTIPERCSDRTCPNHNPHKLKSN